MKAIVVAGGTGGHIYPALAIINKIKAKEKNSQILYIGTKDRMEKDIIPKLGIDFIGLEMSGLNRKNIFGNISVFNKFRKAVKRAGEVLDAGGSLPHGVLAEGRKGCGAAGTYQPILCVGNAPRKQRRRH